MYFFSFKPLMLIERGLKTKSFKGLYISLLTPPPPKEPAECTCLLTHSCILLALGQPHAVKNLVEGHYPANGELCSSTWAQADVVLSLGVIVARRSQLLSNPTSQKHHYPLRSESSCSNTFSCLALLKQNGVFLCPCLMCV